jgi:hypothetical protein
MDKIQGIKEERRGGVLYPLELRIPFAPKRIFWVSDVPINSTRGEHAHKDCQQFYICVKGCLNVECKNAATGNVKNIIMREGDTLFVDKLLWTAERFININTILLVLCSHCYDKNDYIYDIEELRKIVSG